MSRAIELLVKMANPKCVSLETASRGTSNLHREQIISALTFAEKESELGYNLLLAKYCSDKESRDFITGYIELYGKEENLSEVTLNALNLLVDIITDIPLPAQSKRLKSLRNRYIRSQFSHIKAAEKASKIVKENNLEENSPEARQVRIREFNDLRKSNMCPRCRGTGEIGRVQKTECPECNGKGRLIASIDMIAKSLKINDNEFKKDILPKVLEFEQICYREMSKAEIAVKARLKKEIEE